MKLTTNEFDQLEQAWTRATEIYGYLTFQDELGLSKKFVVVSR